MKKTSVFVTSIVLCIASFISPVFAKDDTITIEMLNYMVETDYNSKDAYVVYHENIEDNIYSAEIIDISTQEILQTFSEKPNISISKVKSIINGTSSTRAQDTFESTWSTNVNLVSNSIAPIEAYTWVRVKITAGSSWRQVDEVLDKGHMAGSSGTYTLAAAGTYVKTTKFPCATTLYIDINGIIEVSSTNSVGFSIDILKPLGFSISGSTTSNWYARKSYNKQADFMVMR